MAGSDASRNARAAYEYLTHPYSSHGIADLTIPGVWLVAIGK
jgi:hypothetical protein